LQALFTPGSRLLEIGCGTGDEALALSAAGYDIVATDISPAMIDTARAKAADRGDERVTWRVLPAGRLADSSQELGTETFDGAYASFGALNCEPQLPALAQALSTLVHPSGSVLCSIMNRSCAWEMLWDLAHLRPRWAFRRWRRGWVEAGLASPQGRQTVPTRYYSGREFAQCFAPHFRLVRIRGLPVFLPPPYLADLLAERPGLLRRLAGLERLLAHRRPFRLLGDHTVLVMSRQGT
jgi:SAM-dependent methyltransferase